MSKEFDGRVYCSGRTGIVKLILSFKGLYPDPSARSINSVGLAIPFYPHVVKQHQFVLGADSHPCR